MEREKRTKVRVTNRLEGSETEYRYQINHNMLKMQGQVFTVNKSKDVIENSSAISIWCDAAGRDFRFATCDIKIIKEKPLPMPKPVMFNPETLDV